MKMTDEDHASLVGWLAAAKLLKGGLKFKVLLFFCLSPSPHSHAWPVRLSDTSIPKVNTEDLRGGAGLRPHRSQPPRRLIDHTPLPSSVDRCSLNCRRQRFSFSKRCSPSCDSCRHCGGQTLSNTAYIYKVCPRCEWSYEPLLGPDAWRSDCRSRRYRVASLFSLTKRSRGCGYVKNPA